jgi:hypothetical protein
VEGTRRREYVDRNSNVLFTALVKPALEMEIFGPGLKFSLLLLSTTE